MGIILKQHLKISLLFLFSISHCYNLSCSDHIEQSIYGTWLTSVVSKTEFDFANGFKFGLKMTPLVISPIELHKDYSYQPNTVENNTTVETGAGLSLSYSYLKTTLSTSFSYVFVFALLYPPYYLTSVSAQYPFNKRWSIGTSLNYHYCNKERKYSENAKEYYEFKPPYSVSVLLSHSVNNNNESQKMFHKLFSASGILGFALLGGLFASSFGP